MEVQHHLLLRGGERFDGIAVLHLAVGQHEQERQRFVWAGTALGHLKQTAPLIVAQRADIRTYKALRTYRTICFQYHGGSYLIHKLPHLVSICLQQVLVPRGCDVAVLHQIRGGHILTH